MSLICSGCGDPIVAGNGCCNNCQRGVFGIDREQLHRVRDLYFVDGRTPVKIYKMTRVHPNATRKIIYGKAL